MAKSPWDRQRIDPCKKYGTHDIDEAARRELEEEEQMARSIAAGVAGKCLCANPKCRKEFEPANKYGPKPKMCPECREAGVKLPDVVKPSPGKKKTAAKKHPHPPAKSAAEQHDPAASFRCEMSDDPDRDKHDSPCYRCIRPACQARSVMVASCEGYMEALEDQGGQKAAVTGVDPAGGHVNSNATIYLRGSLASMSGKPKQRDLEELLVTFGGGEPEADGLWHLAAAAVWGYLYGRGLAA